MTGDIDRKLAALGITLPEAPAAAANYVPYVKTGDLVWISGQLSKPVEGALITGRLGQNMAVEAGALAAKACAINLLAQLKAACDGDLDRLERVVKLTGFVNSDPDFTDHPQVINGASDFLVELLGDAGRHARAAVGVAALPFNVAVEIEGVFQVR